MKDDVKFNKGARVTWTDPEDGAVYTGLVDNQRRGWVMIDLDEPRTTGMGWKASKMMLKVADIKAVG